MGKTYSHAAHIFFPVHDWKQEYREGTDVEHTKHLVIHPQVLLQVEMLTEQVAAAVRGNCLARGMDADTIGTLWFGVRLALDELIPNTLKHGHGGDPNKKLLVEWGIEDDTLALCLQDEGPGFDVAAAMAYDPTLPENREDPNGRGMLLVTSFMDTVDTNANGTQFTLTKRLLKRASNVA